MPEERAADYDFASLKGIVARLRSSDGCPWDRQQTHASLQPFLIEECYEVLQAIEEGDPQKLCEELGDLLLQIMLHAQIASEAGQFDIEDVVAGIAGKLVHRHPHVFGDKKAKEAEQVELNWEALKQEEKGAEASLLSGVPETMPALAYSQSVQRRAAAVGFDWEGVDEILDKLMEEVAEIRRASGQQEKAKEFGDLLFTLANIARRLNIDLETALRSANRRFCQRFKYMEQACRERGVELSSLSLEEQNALWEEAKARLK